MTLSPDRLSPRQMTSETSLVKLNIWKFCIVKQHIGSATFGKAHGQRNHPYCGQTEKLSDVGKSPEKSSVTEDGMGSTIIEGVSILYTATVDRSRK